MSAAFQRVVDAFRDYGCTVTDNGHGKAQAQCPTHEDNRPSVTIGPRRKGEGVVLKCGAGCETTDVVAAVGLSMSDLFDDDQLSHAYSAERDYIYSGGRKVHRKSGKTFRQSGATKDRSLYRVELIGDTETIYVTEGEKDAEAIAAIGGTAVCSAMGAGKAHLADWTPLSGKHVIVVRDKDGAGHKHAADVAAILDDTAASVKIVEAVEGKDAADHIAAGCGLGDFREVPNPLLAGLKSAADLDSETFNPVVYHVPNLVPEGFGILAGSPKIGKSWLALAIALACAQGGKLFGSIAVESRPVLLLALEDGERRLQDRMRKLNGDDPLPANLDYFHAGKIARGQESATIKAWMRLHRNEQPLVILDTLVKVLPQHNPGESVYKTDYDDADRIKRISDSIPGSAILAIHHDRKATAEDWLKTLSGSLGITGSADHVLLLARKRNSGEGVLSVTSREANEGEYALLMVDGTWKLDGGSFGEASERARERREKGNLGEQSFDVLTLVNGRAETKATDLMEAFGLSRAMSDKYLSQLTADGRIRKFRRGVYGPVASGKDAAIIPLTQVVEDSEVDRNHHNSSTSLSSTSEFGKGDSPKCEHCGDVLLHPDSVSRGYCHKPKCLLEARRES
ncbi:AAA family ATPase [Mycolicibacterium sp. 120270]|uniref:AAA family ATPase n=1 Tax=Mycolicibacterium sp. 120270 TaxID=3090600 RepID=UPI00299EB2A7|nr:AAA family ATPase [Mycolicibacterium sp. 120270]MDX1882256.1 AAA family ATPase [Mycolicibacterium sp. 120270]